jgi:hypothetical protein
MEHPETVSPPVMLYAGSDGAPGDSANKGTSPTPNLVFPTKPERPAPGTVLPCESCNGGTWRDPLGADDALCARCQGSGSVTVRSQADLTALMHAWEAEGAVWALQEVEGFGYHYDELKAYAVARGRTLAKAAESRARQKKQQEHQRLQQLAESLDLIPDSEADHEERMRVRTVFRALVIDRFDRLIGAIDRLGSTIAHTSAEQIDQMVHESRRSER